MTIKRDDHHALTIDMIDVITTAKDGEVVATLREYQSLRRSECFDHWVAPWPKWQPDDGDRLTMYGRPARYSGKLRAWVAEGPPTESVKVKTMDQWCRVIDGLPSLDVPVWLVDAISACGPYIGVRVGHDGRWARCYDEFWWGWPGWISGRLSSREVIHPTHWMPLPEPPPLIRG